MPRSIVTSVIERFWNINFIDEKLNNWVGYILFPLSAVVFGYLFAQQTLIGIGLIGAIIAIAVIITCLINTEAGLYIIIVYSFFAFLFTRIFYPDFPSGVAFDILIVATLFSLFIKRVNLKSTFNQFMHSSVIITITVLFFYLMLELFNPYAHSFSGWYQTFRKLLDDVFLLFIAYKVLDNYASIKRFLTLLFIVCTICGMYACFQQWHGLLDSEKAWVMADPVRFGLIFIDGDFRKFSTMSDPTAFGIIMASCGVLFSIIALHQKKRQTKFVLFAGLIFIFLGMAYSGTRTADAMAAAGFGMFILLTLNKRSTKVFALVLGCAFAILMYAPIYGNQTLNRFRSIFNASEDQSYKVRQMNRAFIQPYIYSHPIGGGLCTTGAAGLNYNPSHYLAGFPPDSGYLKKALETGWIGLSIICILYFVILKNSIRGYFESKNNEMKMLFATCCACLFSFYMADFAQDAIGQITDTVVYYPIIALTLRLRTLNAAVKDKSA
jgi:O-antigen ligase/polysaccharide polymerase Wzy-like membrane protein